MSERKSSVALLVRHRWVRLLDSRLQFFRCDRRAFPLYASVDPSCYGCGSVILCDDVPGWPRRFRASIDRRSGQTANSARKLEELGVRLDLMVAELKLKEARGVA